MSALLQFRRALAQLKRHYPFSPAFGPCSTRELCLESAQEVFDKLLLRDIASDDALSFDVLAAVAISHGEMDEDKLKEMIKLFRPDRDGFCHGDSESGPRWVPTGQARVPRRRRGPSLGTDWAHASPVQRPLLGTRTGLG